MSYSGSYCWTHTYKGIMDEMDLVTIWCEPLCVCVCVAALSLQSINYSSVNSSNFVLLSLPFDTDPDAICCYLTNKTVCTRPGEIMPKEIQTYRGRGIKVKTPTCYMPRIDSLVSLKLLWLKVRWLKETTWSLCQVNKVSWKWDNLFSGKTTPEIYKANLQSQFISL